MNHSPPFEKAPLQDGNPYRVGCCRGQGGAILKHTREGNTRCTRKHASHLSLNARSSITGIRASASFLTPSHSGDNRFKYSHDLSQNRSDVERGRNKQSRHDFFLPYGCVHRSKAKHSLSVRPESPTHFWHGMVWYVTVRYVTVRYGMLRYDMVWCGLGR